MFLNHFDVLILKIIFLKKKYYFQIKNNNHNYTFKYVLYSSYVQQCIINNTSNHRGFLDTKASLRVILRVELCIA